MKYLVIVLFCLQLSIQAASAWELPETIAIINGKQISAEKIKKLWTATTAKLPADPNPETLARIYRSLTEQYIWQHELERMLSEANIKADKNTAKKYLEQLQKKQYIPSRRFSQEKIDSLLDSPRFQLKSAISLYLQTTVPEKIKVTRPEVVELYRSAPEKFRVPGKENWKIIEVADIQSAHTVRSLLLQGSSFASVANRFSPRGMQSPLPSQLLLQGSKMKINDISPVIKSANGWIVAKLHTREKSSFIPLEKVYAQLASTLADSKEAAALTEILQKRLSTQKIIYIPLKHSKSP